MQFAREDIIPYIHSIVELMKQDKILIIDDDPDVLLSARMLLEQLDFDVSMLSDPEKILPRLKEGEL